MVYSYLQKGFVERQVSRGEIELKYVEHQQCEDEYCSQSCVHVWVVI